MILAIVFAVWYGVERTLSMHSIVTTRREALLLAGDPLHVRARHRRRRPRGREGRPRLRRLDRACGAAVIALITFAPGLKANPILTFWLAYILTRPLGASIGDEMSQNSHQYGGLGLGTTNTSYIFLGCDPRARGYLSVTKRDQTPPELVERELRA